MKGNSPPSSLSHKCIEVLLQIVHENITTISAHSSFSFKKLHDTFVKGPKLVGLLYCSVLCCQRRVKNLARVAPVREASGLTCVRGFTTPNVVLLVGVVAPDVVVGEYCCSCTPSSVLVVPPPGPVVAVVPTNPLGGRSERGVDKEVFRQSAPAAVLCTVILVGEFFCQVAPPFRAIVLGEDALGALMDMFGELMDTVWSTPLCP